MVENSRQKSSPNFTLNFDPTVKNVTAFFCFDFHPPTYPTQVCVQRKTIRKRFPHAVIQIKENAVDVTEDYRCPCLWYIYTYIVSYQIRYSLAYEKLMLMNINLQYTSVYQLFWILDALHISLF